jgi:hypothetical protein
MNKRILVIGYSGSGKTTAANCIAPNISTSDVIIGEFCHKYDLHPEVVKANKGFYRDRLWQFGRDRQQSNPLYFVYKALEKSSIVTGVRNPDEVAKCRELKIFDVIIWIDRPGITAGSTDKLTSADADVIVMNDGDTNTLKASMLYAAGY